MLKLNMKPIPILILNWNGSVDTVECVEAVLRQTYPDFTLHLVDNGSEDSDYAVLLDRFGNHPHIRLIRNPENLGFTRGCNRIMTDLLAHGKTDYIALLNNDAVPEPDWLERLAQCAQERGAGMVSSKMVNYYDRSSLDNAGHKLLNTAEILPIGHGEPVEAHTTPFANVGACAGAALYATAMLNAIGLFDEYFDTGYEDAELGVRANLLGYSTVFEPTAVVYHKMSRSVNRIKSFATLTKTQTNIFYTYLKLMPLPVILLNVPFFLFKYGCVVVFDLVFWRAAFLRMLGSALHTVFITDRSFIWRNRQRFIAEHRPVPFLRALRLQELFLRTDIKRFINFLKGIHPGGLPKDTAD